VTPLEALLVGLAGLVFFLSVLDTPTPPAARLLLGAAQDACLLLHVGLDGARWQMVPAYAVTASVWGPVFLRRLRSREKLLRRRGPARSAWILGGAWLACSGLLPVALPVARWLTPTGSSPIGTRYLLLADTSRTEPFEPRRSSFREITAQVWYPAEDDCRDHAEHYWRDASARSRAWTKAHDLDWIPFLWSHLDRIPIHACLHAPISSRPPAHPVLVFSHGYWQIGGFNTALMEELASHGYVVLSIAHAFETPFSIYPDGRIPSCSKTQPR